MWKLQNQNSDLRRINNKVNYEAKSVAENLLAGVFRYTSLKILWSFKHHNDSLCEDLGSKATIKSNGKMGGQRRGDLEHLWSPQK